MQCALCYCTHIPVLGVDVDIYRIAVQDKKDNKLGLVHIGFCSYLRSISCYKLVKVTVRLSHF